MPLLLIELMRSASPAATRALFEDETFREALSMATFFPHDPKTEDGAKGVKKLQEHATRILTEIKCPDDVHAAILPLVDAFRDRTSMLAAPNISYWAHLDDQPPIFTWREFNALLAAWRAKPTATDLQELVEAHMRVLGSPAEATYRELFETTLMHRGTAVANAAEVVVDEQISVQMNEADLALALLRIVISDQQGFSCKPSILTGKHFTQLLEQFGHWAHFRNHARYKAAREAERSLLLEAARHGASFASETIDALGPWSGLFAGFSPELAELKQAVIQALNVHVFDDLLARFSRKDGISALWGKDRHLVEKHYLFHRSGGFYTDVRIGRLKELAEQAKTSQLVQENFYHYLRLLAYGLRGNSQTLTVEELKPLAQDAEIVSSVWRGATAQPLQPRVVGDLSQVRITLESQLPKDQPLPLPPWWPVEPLPTETTPASAEVHKSAT
jgi:hypothetical protein